MNNAAATFTDDTLRALGLNAAGVRTAWFVALRAELSRARLLATCAASRPEQARALVANPAGAYMRYASAARYVAELAGGIARARFLGQLG